MHKLEDGILDSSEIYFLQPSSFAEQSLFYLQHLGIFECDDRYVVTHPYWESVLLLFIDEGELEVSFRQENFIARQGDIVLLDCRYEHRISVYIHMILCEISETCHNLPAANTSIEQSVRFMEKHLTENVSLDEISAHVGLSKYYFNRLFRRYMGMTPHQYFLNMRVQYAKKLLMTTHDSIENVAEKCGFDSPSNFIRLFRQHTGMTPAAFRKIPF